MTKVVLRRFASAMVTLAMLGGTCAAQPLTGAGSTFITPILQKWITAYSTVEPSTPIAYQSIGSLEGVDKLLSRSVDFAASDAPLNLAQLDQPSCQVLYFPVTLGAVVVVYNLPQLPAAMSLRLTGTVVANIFLGKIRKWNDPAIAAANPDVRLPGQEIYVTYRGDGSGTTYTFTDYLSKVSPAWEKGPGRGLLVLWPIGSSAQGNDGVAEAVKSQAGAIGYVELEYAISSGLRFAEVQNREGKWVKASADTVTAASDSVISQMPADLKQSITDSPGAASCPISSYSYLLIFKSDANRARAASLRKFITWVMKDGQSFAAQLNYGTLPANLLSSANDQLKETEQVALRSPQACKTLGLAPHRTGPFVIRHEEDENSLSND